MKFIGVHLSLLLLLLYSVGCSSIQDAGVVYVSPTGDDGNEGSFGKPLKSIQYAVSKAETSLKQEDIDTVTIYLKNGVYGLTETLQITNRKENGLIRIKGSGTKTVISGGKALSPDSWKKLEVRSNGILWEIGVQDVVRQLYKGDIRVKRASSPVFFTNGAMEKYRSRISRFGFDQANELKKETLEAHCTFRYSNGDLDNLTDFENAEVLVHHSWESSWHEIARVDKKTKGIYLTNGFRYPIGIFGDKEAYKIENSLDYLNEPNTWVYDKKRKSIIYFSSIEEDPRSEEFTIPVLERLVTMEGSSESFVGNVHFTELSFAHTIYPWGVNDIEKTFVNHNEKIYSWMDFKKGYSGAQTAPLSGHALQLVYTEDVTFEKCTFYNLGAYALKIGKGSRFINVLNSELYDNGSGGIIIGEPVRKVEAERFPKTDAPHNNTIVGNSIKDSGIIHPSGVGVAIMQSFNNRIESNIIHDMPYSGISLGWTWDESLNYTEQNQVLNNEIYRVMKLLADGAAIYTLGQQKGTVIKGNKISDIKKSPYAIGAGINGIFFDQASADIVVEDNIIKGVEGDVFKYNKSLKEKIMLRNNRVN